VNTHETPVAFAVGVHCSSVRASCRPLKGGAKEGGNDVPTVIPFDTERGGGECNDSSELLIDGEIGGMVGILCIGDTGGKRGAGGSCTRNEVVDDDSRTA